MLVRTWATPAIKVGLTAGAGDPEAAIGPGSLVPQNIGMVAQGFKILGAGLVPALARRWTIGVSGDEHGYSAPLAFGGLEPNAWFDEIATVDGLFVDGSSNAVVLRASDDSQWAGLSAITIVTEGFTDILLTYNGTFYVVVDAAYTAYIVGQLGNTLDLRILPETVSSWFDTEAWVDSEPWND